MGCGIATRISIYKLIGVAQGVGSLENIRLALRSLSIVNYPSRNLSGIN